MNLELTPAALLSNLHSQTPYLRSAKKILVAYSGGLDSHVLLYLLSRIARDEFELRAIYVNHGLQDQATQWEDHCRQVCLALDVPFSAIQLTLDIPKGESLEEIARVGRYKALHAELQQGEVLVTAHHQADQAETFLLQLFRGAGVQGLSAMPHANTIESNGTVAAFHLRPLLNYSRQVLEQYANAYNLQHIEDPSNQDTSFDRNFLRQEIMPLLRNRWLGIDKAISRSAGLHAESQSLLDEMAQLQLPDVLSSTLTQFTDSKLYALVLAPIEIPKLLQHSKAKQRLLLRHWIAQQGFLTPSAKKLQHIFSDCIESAEDKQPLIEWQGAELRRFKHHLYIMQPLSKHDESQIIPWISGQALYIESINMTIPVELFEKTLGDTKQNVTIRFRQGGESIEIPKRGRISLKNLFQEEQIPPWIRSRLPLIYIGEKLVKIIGLDRLKAVS